ncbi:MAG: pyridoxamine 5'-phosphate oxidase family protein [Actinomycetota bacterium]
MSDRTNLLHLGSAQRSFRGEGRSTPVGQDDFPVLAIVAPNGAPNQSVMWFDLDPEQPDTIVMNTKTGRAKNRWLREGAPVSLLFEDRLFYYAFQGRVELDDDPESALAVIKELARRYGADPATFDGQKRVTIRMRVEKVIRHD